MSRLNRGLGASIPALSWRECFAKSTDESAPGLKVLTHSRDVGEVTRALLRVLPAPVAHLIGANSVAAAACHDVGKVSPGYQLKYFRENLRQRLPELATHAQERYETRHALIGEAAISAHMGHSGSIAQAVGAHHGVRDDLGLTHDADVFGGPAWAQERGALIAQLSGEYGRLDDASPIDPHVLAGLVCVADWIGSDERFFPPSGQRSTLGTTELAEAAIAGCGWQQVSLRTGLSFKEVFDRTAYSIQRDFYESVQGPGLYVLEAPMGSGKTEAALYAAYQLMSSGANSGLYFGLPTRLTSDKIHERVIAFLKKVAGDDTALRLAHGNAWLRAFQPGGGALAPGKEWFSPSKRALLMPFGVGTIDQALLAVLKVRHFFVRCFGLAGKVVILDEVHSYDMYTGTLLDLLVRRLLGMKCSVIVLSATLTRLRRASLMARPQPVTTGDEYPLITAETEAGVLVRPSKAPQLMEVEIQLSHIADGEVAELAVAKAGTGQCVLCIANTVEKAQRWYNEVKTAMSEGAFAVGLLHSKFPGWRRNELEARWTAALGETGPRPMGCVLVATQVVEQSVDLDSDFMISELAPTDMLLQRIGRLWRHQRQTRPCAVSALVVVTADLDVAKSFEELLQALGKPNTRVYAPYVLWQTFQAWKGVRSLRLPGDIRLLLEKTYSEPSGLIPAFVEEAHERLARRAKKLRGLANAARTDMLGFPAMDDREGAPTRYSDLPMLDIVLARSVTPNGLGASIVLSSGVTLGVDSFKWVPQLAVELHRNLVPVPCYRLPRAKTPPYLLRYFHNRTPLLVLEDDGELTLEGQPTAMRYDQERGLQLANMQAATAKDIAVSADIDYEEERELDELDW